jgi:predicted nucleotidyltransferase
MRLTALERHAIREAALRHFGVAPRLFGSRLDDSRRGGDIDLLVETRLPADQAVRHKLDLLAELWLALGERKIDVLLDDGSDLPVLRHARQQGVSL